MPTLQLKISPPQSPERYHALAGALTALTVLHLGKRAKVTAVMIDELPPTRWFIDSASVQGPTALVEISVTQGSNTALEKSNFIAAVFEELQNQLGREVPLAPASYVIVTDVVATDWGYGGRTQAARRPPTTPAA
jgi:4-oxalocrotonate tautomerase